MLAHPCVGFMRICVKRWIHDANVFADRMSGGSGHEDQSRRRARFFWKTRTETGLTRDTRENPNAVDRTSASSVLPLPGGPDMSRL